MGEHNVSADDPLGSLSDRASLVQCEVVKQESLSGEWQHPAHPLPSNVVIKVGVATQKPVIEVHHEGEEGHLPWVPPEGSISVNGGFFPPLIPHHPDTLIHHLRDPSPPVGLWQVRPQSPVKFGCQLAVVKVNLGVEPQLTVRLAIFTVRESGSKGYQQEQQEQQQMDGGWGRRTDLGEQCGVFCHRYSWQPPPQ